jgi:alpha-L-rhamnosidase
VKPLAAAFLLLAFCAALSAAEAPGPAPTGLMCDLLAMPERTVITDPQPELGWIVHSNLENDVQTAYQIRLAATPAALARKRDCLWDTGKTPSDQSVAVQYAGRSLESHRSYCWQVRTWNRQGRASAWSAPQQFRTGELRTSAGGAGLPKGRDRSTVDRYPLQQTELSPARVVELAKGHTFLDFGRAAFGALKLTFLSPENGHRIIVHLGEALEGANRVHRRPGGSIRYHRAEMVLEAGKRTYTVPLTLKDGRMMPPEIGPVMPFRYVEVENCPSVLDKNTARQVAAHYPFNDTAATFTCSDRRLNDIWELCRYSMKATSFCGVYVDGDRERLPYEADAYLNQLGHYCSDREFTLARYSHEHLIQHPTWPTEWILHSVLMAWADYMHTGDTESLALFYEDLKAKTLRALAREDGLISTVQPPASREVLASIHSDRMRDIVDWPAGERDGYDMRPVNTVVNAFHYRAMALMGEIAEALKKPQDAQEFRSGAQRAARAFNEKLFDEKTGLYVDGEGSAHSSLHANMLAVAFGLAPPERIPRVAQFIRSRGMACSVYGAQYLLEALYLAGQADHALALMTARNDRSWAHMVYDVGTTITLEAWDNKYKPNQDWNHAWGAAPANIIPRMLMGVEPLEAGFRKIRIRPQPGGLERAALDVPTIRGTVHVDFESSASRFVLNVRLPANTTAQVHLPRLGSEDPAVTVDGVRRRGRVEGGFLVVEAVGSGTHTLSRVVK